MGEESYNHVESGEAAGGLDDEFIPADGLPVCPNCLTPCKPFQNYCEKCDSNEVINPLASYMPFVDIRFVYGFFGKLWRRVWYDREASVVFRLLCLLCIVLFAPLLLIVGLPLFLIGKIPVPRLGKLAAVVLCIIAVVLLVLLIVMKLPQLVSRGPGVLSPP